MRWDKVNNATVSVHSPNIVITFMALKSASYPISNYAYSNLPFP